MLLFLRSLSLRLPRPPPPPPKLTCCFHSKTTNVQSPDDESVAADKTDPLNGDLREQDQVPAFKEYGFAELRVATKGFSPETF
ncbi:serine threonine-protein kinase [Musa troglodytarum]|uniref:Serine threonine-protein kinase n=1 Tax=Musa troglodytarum TaxID=320322 RepID=A0A9E7FL75_9LILI|nr:serine threonine-protein kinase [Musa troglodytarum]